ncbi:SDR family oxidoreductase [Amaricoccus solimangrovi]|uniref:SDR family oxidoreductase n=1 Tax=Amaricoccus solimangrovi TaxID=2589815 RepID=A0A501WSB1_9RHOB|nr:SDR family oxidoreductase [Amaricoccus solimangrovi]TPE52623.1 SDR family oxidoreductase [Amaricoccus solimangrovi]
MTDGPVLLTIGHGYSAAAFAASLPEGWRRIGATRSGEKAATMAAAGVEPVDAGDAAAMRRAIAAASHLLISAPPGEEGDPVLGRHGAALAAARPAWVGYLSTTGVYGDRNGGWVDEEGALAPVNARSARRVEAERAWLGSGLPVEIFRLAGIYGPGRSVFDRLREGRAQRIVKPGQVFSRIHVEDIAGALRAAVARPAPGRIVNLADDAPAPPGEVILYAAGLLGMEPPPGIAFDEADLSPMARSFYNESKRVSNRRMREELGYAPRYPDYRAGLAAVLAAERLGAL